MAGRCWPDSVLALISLFDAATPTPTARGEHERQHRQQRPTHWQWSQGPSLTLSPRTRMTLTNPPVPRPMDRCDVMDPLYTLHRSHTPSACLPAFPRRTNRLTIPGPAQLSAVPVHPVLTTTRSLPSLLPLRLLTFSLYLSPFRDRHNPLPHYH